MRTSWARWSVGTSTPGRWPPSQSVPGPALHGRRWRFVLAGCLLIVLAATGGVGAWAASDPGSYETSRNGCLTVTIASSTGGAMRHECGDAARAWCQSVHADHDKLALLIQRQCQLTGIDPATSPEP